MNVAIVVSGVVRRNVNLHWFALARVELETTHTAPDIVINWPVKTTRFAHFTRNKNIDFDATLMSTAYVWNYILLYTL